MPTDTPARLPVLPRRSRANAACAPPRRRAGRLAGPRRRDRQRDRARGDPRRFRHADAAGRRARSRRRRRARRRRAGRRRPPRTADDDRRRRGASPGSTRTADATSRSSVGRDSARALAAFYAFSDELLRALHAEAPASDEPSPVRLWPEHFDVAFEQGAEAEGRRATTALLRATSTIPSPTSTSRPGASRRAGPGWTATGFRGAELGYAALREARRSARAGARVLPRPPRRAARAAGALSAQTPLKPAGSSCGRPAVCRRRRREAARCPSDAIPVRAPG